MAPDSTSAGSQQCLIEPVLERQTYPSESKNNAGNPLSGKDSEDQLLIGKHENEGNLTHRRVKNTNNNESDVHEEEDLNEKNTFKPQIRWPDLIVQIFLHVGCLYGIFLILTTAKFYTSLFGEYSILFNTILNSISCYLYKLHCSFCNNLHVWIRNYCRSSPFMVT